MRGRGGIDATPVNWWVGARSATFGAPGRTTRRDRTLLDCRWRICSTGGVWVIHHVSSESFRLYQRVGCRTMKRTPRGWEFKQSISTCCNMTKTVLYLPYLFLWPDLCVKPPELKVYPTLGSDRVSEHNNSQVNNSI